MALEKAPEGEVLEAEEGEEEDDVGGFDDDGPDAVHGAFKELFTITRVDKFPVRTVSRADMRRKSKNDY